MLDRTIPRGRPIIQKGHGIQSELRLLQQSFDQSTPGVACTQDDDRHAPSLAFDEQRAHGRFRQRREHQCEEKSGEKDAAGEHSAGDDAIPCDQTTEDGEGSQDSAPQAFYGAKQIPGMTKPI